MGAILVHIKPLTVILKTERTLIMNKNFLLILLVFGLLHTINAQDKSDIVIIDTKYNISVPSDKFVKEIIVQKGLIKKRQG